MYIQFAKFFVVGGLATAADMTVFHILANVMDIYYITANTISNIVGLFISYYLSREWVFNWQNHNFLRDFTLFTVTSLIGVLLNNLIMYFLIDYRIMNELMNLVNMKSDSLVKLSAKLIAAAVVLVWNFISKRLFVFNSN